MKIETVAVIVALADGGLTAPKPEADAAPEQNRVNVATVDDANVEQTGVMYDSLRPRDNQEVQAGPYRRRGVSGRQGGVRGGRGRGRGRGRGG
ncbi:hypothetical protein X797_011036 [Metarhizium robertsii]|uniref:Uncharacterized protein n=2 Tax=Metarhizium robertsii TaxID=568076 RepID=E9FCX2_METRA|nr:uncharacterized protein MAA_10121 [Metarhizium robertsii ARSEF 23]EFY94444.1 hypothetical protein MAA_10121 [Metarhizium robertsii ARSEF 23]EXU95855.1 hypothetical protein X797_011036 [Metarhizium robertsii]